MNINYVGYGLSDSQREVLMEYRSARRILALATRAQFDAALPAGIEEEANRSKKFAFWIVLTRIQQDRPLFFWSGSFFLVLSILKTIQDAVGYLAS